MAEVYDTVFKGATVVNHDGVAVRDIGVTGGRIAGLGDLSAVSSGERVDCRGLHVLPGVIDSHVHFREPGSEQKEDLETGSRAAVMGGVTAIFEMPNTEPTTTTVEALSDKLQRAHGRMQCDHAFYVGATQDNIDQLGELEALPGAAGIKVFMASSTGSLLLAEDEEVASVLRNVRRIPVFHCEDEERLRERLSFREDGRPETHHIWRDEIAALKGTERLVRLARAAGKPVHVLHVSTAEEIEFLAGHKDIASVEVTPHHLSLTVEDYARLGNRLQMNPPVREGRHVAGVWAGVAGGVADTIGSDHAPHLLEEKAMPYPASPSGMAGVQTLVPVMLDHVNRGRMSIERFVDMTSHGPARLFQIAAKGRIAVGYDADLTIVDMKRRETIRDSWIESRCGWTPYAGREIMGWPVGTVIRGNKAMWEGELTGRGLGRPVRFRDTLSPR